jgi:hypothetical protein
MMPENIVAIVVGPGSDLLERGPWWPNDLLLILDFDLGRDPPTDVQHLTQ